MSTFSVHQLVSLCLYSIEPKLNNISEEEVGEADENSDLDFLVFGGEGFKLTSILALGEELREVLKKKVDIFEIREVNQDSEFYRTIMREKVLVA